MVDDYNGYKTLFAGDGNKTGCTELVCLAHVRRKFFDLYQANQYPQGHKGQMAKAALENIAYLYFIETQAKDLIDSAL